MKNFLRLILFAAFALLVGLFGLSLFSSDLGPGESIASRFIIAAVYLISGLFTGYFIPR